MTVRYHLEAVEEYDRAVSYYAAISPPLAASLIGEVERSIERIVAHPLHGREMRPNIRAVHTRVFPYQVVYMIEDDSATVLAVVHDKREPEYWRHRVN